jgi:hypothetical protein
VKQLKLGWIIALSLTRNESLFSASSPPPLLSAILLSIHICGLEVSLSSFLPAFLLGTCSKELISMYSLL